jgi:hypothetical protein
VAHPILKSLVTGVAGAALLAACSHTTPNTPVQPQAAALSAQSTDADRPEVAPSKALGRVSLADDSRFGLTPEKAEGKARERATAWHSDAELRFVAWGVVKWELLSAVSHIFYSPSTHEVLVVKTLLRDKWQDANAFNQVVVTKPAEVLQSLDSGYKIDGDRALKLARRHFIFGKHPVSLVTLSHPPKLPFAFWGIISPSTVVLVHANTGQSISNHGIDPFPKEWAK